MTAKEVRNIISRRLHGFIGQPVILHEQDVGEPAPPLLYYRFISPLIPLGGASIWHEGGKQYLVADGGSVMYHDLRVTTNDLLANLWFNLLVRMDGFESGSIVPRRYRIEMTNVNEKTGECTLGNLEVFSRSKGWVPGQDPSIARHTASKFPSLSGGAHDLGIAADYFKGCTLKLAKKRDDVLWYPPLEWAKSQTEYDKKIEKMKDTYLHFITDCEALFGL